MTISKKMGQKPGAGVRKKKKLICEEILCAGFGGQGIMFMGKLLATAALSSDKFVTWMPAYGAEVRGGTAYCITKVSEREIASPLATRPSFVIVMNRPSLLKYIDKVREGGILISNKTMAGDVPRRKDIDIINIPVTKMASALGNTKCSNMIALGAFAKKSGLLSLKNIRSALKYFLKDKQGLYELNKKALDAGFKAAGKSR